MNKFDCYVLFTFDGDVLPLAVKLQDEGENVWVCQIKDGSAVGVKSWITDKEEPEERKRRLSLYDGLLEKHDLKETLKMLEGVENKDGYFIVFGFNSLYKISEKVLKMGYVKGLFPIEEDYEREQNRQRAKDFVKKNYPGLKVAEVKEISTVEEAVKFVQESDKVWCVKSDGNFGETIVPGKDDLEAAKAQVIAELNLHKKDFSKGKLLLEPKIKDAVESAPQMAWWEGVPIYSQVELETRMLGAGDRGPQTGGNENLIIPTELDCPINEIAFPKIIHEIAKRHKGLFLADAGILADGKDLYFTEFAGNRWGWGGVFTEMSGAEKNGRMVSSYFEAVSEGINPYRHKFATSLAVYALESDPEEAGLPKDGIPIVLTGKDAARNFFIMQCRLNEENEGEQLVSVGYREYNSSPLGYVVGRGKTVKEAVGMIYKNLEGISFKGLYSRPEEDFLGDEYVSSVLNRLDFLKTNNYI